MKKLILILFFAIFTLTCSIQSITAAVFHSVAVGGKWDSDATWLEPGHPGTGDTVYVQSTVIVGYTSGYNTFNSFGGWVFVEPGGHLIPHEYGGGLGTFALILSGDIVNKGSITNDEEHLHIIVSGNVTNNGVWQPFKTKLEGAGDQIVTIVDNQPLGGFWEITGSGKVIAGSDLVIDCRYFFSNDWHTGDFNLNNRTLDMGSHVIDATGTLVWGGTIEGDFEIRGLFNVNKNVSDTLIFIGNITIADTLQANAYGGGLGIQELRVEGNLTNNGWIKDHEDTENGDELNILITGNIHNNGRWTCMHVNFIGDQDQYISQSEGAFFESNFYDLEPQSKIIAQTDITITQNIGLNSSTLDMQQNMLALTGWLMDGTLENGMLHGGFLNNVTAVTAIHIYGVVTVDNDNVFDCQVDIQDTLRSNEYGGGSTWFDLVVNGNFNNYGVIKDYNSGDKLRLYLNADVMNRGMWMNSETVLSGSGDQDISQTEGAAFHGNFKFEKSGSVVFSSTDLVLTGDLNLGETTLHMQGHELQINGWLTNGILDDASLKNGFLNGITATTSLEILGVVTIDDDNVFETDLVVLDTLQSNEYGGGAGYFDLMVEGSLTNHGLIRNINSGDRLLLWISGDLTNNGQWENYQTTLNGTSDQTIRLMQNKSIVGQVLFDAMTVNGPYQWYFEDELLSSPDFGGETAQVLNWNVPVSQEWYGTFYCETGGGFSRIITVEAGFYQAINLGAVQLCTDVELSWEMEAFGDPESWNVYRDEAFLANVDEMTFTDLLLNPGYDYAYSVTAVYPEGESGHSESLTIAVEMPANLHPLDFLATVEGEEVLCSWNPPQGCLDPNGYNIFKDGELLNEVLLINPEFTDKAEPGTWEYYVEAVYYFGSSDPSNVETVEVTGLAMRQYDALEIFPNPAVDQLIFKSDSKVISVGIFDLNGTRLGFQKNDNEYSFDISYLSPGSYMLIFETKKGFVNKKLIKQ